jgi:hypothetical protein
MVLRLLLFNIRTTMLTSTNRCFQISTIITIAVCIAIFYGLALTSISCAVGVHCSPELNRQTHREGGHLIGLHFPSGKIAA